MWTCNLCNRAFKRNNQSHYCGDKTVGHFLVGKSEHSLALFDELMSTLAKIGPVNCHATKSTIIIAADLGFAYIINIGKSFLDLVLPFKTIQENNLCFRKIGKVPGSNTYNHHLRLMFPEDLNEEVLSYLKKAYNNGKAV
jgi:hypothetical protein